MPSASSGGSSPADGGAAAVSDPGATVPVAPRIVEPLVAEALRGAKSLGLLSVGSGSSNILR